MACKEKTLLWIKACAKTVAFSTTISNLMKEITPWYIRLIIIKFMMNLIMNLVLRQIITTIKALQKQNSLICNSTRNTKLNCIILRRSLSASSKILSVRQAMRCPLIYMLLRWHGSTNSNSLFSMTKSMTFTIMNSTTINKLRNSTSKIIILGRLKMLGFSNRLTNILELTTSKILQTLWWKEV